MAYAFTEQQSKMSTDKRNKTILRCFSNDTEVNINFGSIGKVKKIINFKFSLLILFESGRLYQFDWNDSEKKYDKLFNYRDTTLSGEEVINCSDE